MTGGINPNPNAKCPDLVRQVKVPLVTTNRINMPHTAERVLAEGHADLVSMARYFTVKALHVFPLTLTLTKAVNATCST